MSDGPQESSVSALSTTGRLLMLTVAFLGWLCAGFHLSITSVAMQPAVIDLLDRSGSLDQVEYIALNTRARELKQSDSRTLSPEEESRLTAWRGLVTKWFSWTQCAFLFGAAAGGLLFGAIGDRLGRTKGMALAILTYSSLSGVTYFSSHPVWLCLGWFLACTGVGGMWPNGVALVSEAWSSLSRPLAAGIIGTAANIGIFLMSTLATRYPVTPQNWPWVMLVGAVPLALGLVALFGVPESPHWLKTHADQKQSNAKHTSQTGRPGSREVFRTPLLKMTLLGVALATIPTLGAWGSANWMVPWAAEAGETATPPNSFLKAQVNQYRSMTGIVGSLLGGWLANTFGRRTIYFLTSLGALISAQYAFWLVQPTDADFLWWVSALGLFSGIYFGWLPLCLPELFPTRSRSTGAGVSFNFGRILTAVTVFLTGTLTQIFAGDYARIGRVTSLIFVVGMLIAFLVPKASKKCLAD